MNYLPLEYLQVLEQEFLHVPSHVYLQPRQEFLHVPSHVYLQPKQEFLHVSSQLLLQLPLHAV